MVEAYFFWKGARGPSLHPCAQHRNHVDPSSRQRHVSPDLLETLTAKHLTGPRHVVEAAEAIVVCLATLVERRSRQPQPRIGLELREQELEVVRLERNVSV